MVYMLFILNYSFIILSSNVLKKVLIVLSCYSIFTIVAQNAVRKVEGRPVFLSFLVFYD